jgi:hypothetical protein
MNLNVDIQQQQQPQENICRLEGAGTVKRVYLSAMVCEISEWRRKIRIPRDERAHPLSLWN